MWSDHEARVVAARNSDGDGRRQTAVGAKPVHDLAHGAHVERVVLERLDERLLEVLGTSGVEQATQSRGSKPMPA